MKPRLYTSHWRAVYDHAKLLDADGKHRRAPGYLPVRISRGGPRYWSEAKAFPALQDLMPEGWMLGIVDDLEKFGRAYRRKLHTIGPPAIQAQFEELTLSYLRPIVLLCFEPDPAECHRGSPFGFAAWWEKKTGQLVPEVGVEDLGRLKAFDTNTTQGEGQGWRQ